MLNERVECLWYFYGHTELWNPAHRNESYACIDFNLDRLEIKQTTKLGRLHARVNTHPRSVKYDFMNVHLMLSIFKQLSRTKKQHQKKWIEENVDWNANSVGCTTPNANVQCSTSIQNNRLSYFIATLFFFFCVVGWFSEICVLSLSVYCVKIVQMNLWTELSIQMKIDVFGQKWFCLVCHCIV